MPIHVDILMLAVIFQPLLELNFTNLSQSISPDFLQKSLKNSFVNLLIILEYDSDNSAFFSFALCPNGSTISVYRFDSPEINSQNRCPQYLK